MPTPESSDCQGTRRESTDGVADARRRGLLGAAVAGLVGVLVVPGVRLVEVAQAQGTGAALHGGARWGLLVDTRLCEEGCDACVRACRSEHQLAPVRNTQSVQWIRKVELREPRSGRTQSLPVMCQHCASPPCVDVCPTGASFKRDDGIVLVDKHRCIGCRYCVMACPYKARSFVHEPVQDQRTHSPRGMGTVEGCNLCVHRVDRGQTPACVQSCAAEARGAMVFGNLNDPSSAIVQRLHALGGRALREDLQLDPGVRYANL